MLSRNSIAILGRVISIEWKEMGSRKYYLLVNTEASDEGEVWDFAAFLIDTHGRLVKSCKVLVNDNHSSKNNRQYQSLLNSGGRQLASVGAINRWFEVLQNLYTNIILTADGLSDITKQCVKTGIGLNGFNQKFCLRHAAITHICSSQKYQRHMKHKSLDTAILTNLTPVADYILNSQTKLSHLAAEDAYEIHIPVLTSLLSKPNIKSKLIDKTDEYGKASRKLKVKKRTSMLFNIPHEGAVLDLTKYEIHAPGLLHLPREYKVATKLGRLPRPNLAIANDDQLTTMIIPSNAGGLKYVTVENLPNLTTLVIQPRFASLFEQSRKPEPTLRWLICRNLPRLEKVVLDSGLYWLEIENAPLLKTIDVHRSRALDYFSLRQCANLSELSVTGCRKLRKIDDLPLDQYSSLKIQEQISATQRQSKLNGRLYEDMTYTDVDYLLEKINAFVRLANDRGWMEGFRDYTIKLGRPLEFFLNGNSGEACPYRLGEQDSWDSIETCLSTILDSVCDDVEDQFTQLVLDCSFEDPVDEFKNKMKNRAREIQKIINRYHPKTEVGPSGLGSTSEQC